MIILKKILTTYYSAHTIYLLLVHSALKWSLSMENGKFFKIFKIKKKLHYEIPYYYFNIIFVENGSVLEMIERTHASACPVTTSLGWMLAL